MVAAVDAFDPRRPIAEGRIDAGLPQIGRFEHVRVRRENEGQHRYLLSLTLDRGQYLWQPAHRRQACPGAERGRARLVIPCPAAVKIGSGSRWADPSSSRAPRKSALTCRCSAIDECEGLRETSHLTHHLFSAVRRCRWQRDVHPSTQAVLGKSLTPDGESDCDRFGGLVVTVKQRG